MGRGEPDAIIRREKPGNHCPKHREKNYSKTRKAARSGVLGPRARTTKCLSLREKLILGVVCFQLFLLPWWIGGTSWQAQLTGSCLSALAFVLLFLPVGRFEARNLTKDERKDAFLRKTYALSSSPKENFYTLIKLPPFWLGFAFVAYITIAMLNADFDLVYLEGNQKTVEPRPMSEYFRDLPKSIATPYVDVGPGRTLVYWAGAWLFACAIFIGLKSRIAWNTLLSAISMIGVTVALAVILQIALGWDKVLGVFETKARFFRGPYIYRGHAGVLLYLSMASTFALLAGGIKKRVVNFGLLVALSILIIGLLATGSRGALVFGGIIFFVSLLICISCFTDRITRVPKFYSLGIAISALLVVIALLSPLGQRSMNVISGRWHETVVQLDRGLEDYLRVRAWKQCFVMFKDRPVFGWGPGSFPWRFPVYQSADPNLRYLGYGKLKREGRLERVRRAGNLKIAFWKYAHSDPVQILCEYGVVGATLLVASVSYWYSYLLIFKRFVTRTSLILILSGALFQLHSFIDFVHYNPSLLLVFLVLIIAGVSCLKKPT